MTQSFKMGGEGEGAILLPTPEPKGELVLAGDTGAHAMSLPAELNLPKLITDAGDKARLRFVNFFTAEIENDNTRMAYYRAVRQFDAWCEKRGIGLQQLQPFVVATYAKELKEKRHPQTVKQHLAALRMLFDNLVIGQVIPNNPAASVRGPKYSTKKGKTPVLTQDETQKLIRKIDTSHLVGLRDRALIGTMVYTFARVSAVINMRVEDFYQTGIQWKVRLHEKGGKFHEVFAHHNLIKYLHEYIEAAGIADDKKAPLFRTAEGRKRTLTEHAMDRHDAIRMVKRRAHDAGVSDKIGCHTFRATGITNYLMNDGTLEFAQKLACHESARTTGLYDRRDDEVSLDEIEKIKI
ncbi:MAG: tyrosine-type recombinase/integrase [Armatimonadetes bacterium]|nr:tyrosine-type recombinase/integrase [Armatimonadota bacterium]